MQEHDQARWFQANRANWDERVPIHVASRFYDVAGFLAGRNTLQPFERDEVGDVSRLDLLHLQCHFGLDTLSWARLGARVVGLDFSEPAIEAARKLAHDTGLAAEFVAANVYDAPNALGPRQFDIVYVGMGSLVWLPDVSRWARVVAQLLRPGGRLYLCDGHPLSEILADDDLTVVNGYFSPEPQVWDEAGTYADRAAPTANVRTYQWAHSMSEPHPTDGTCRMPAGMPSIPMTYSLGASKPVA